MDRATPDWKRPLRDEFWPRPRVALKFRRIEAPIGKFSSHHCYRELVGRAQGTVGRFYRFQPEMRRYERATVPDRLSRGAPPAISTRGGRRMRLGVRHARVLIRHPQGCSSTLQRPRPRTAPVRLRFSVRAGQRRVAMFADQFEKRPRLLNFNAVADSGHHSQNEVRALRAWLALPPGNRHASGDSQQAPQKMRARDVRANDGERADRHG